MDAAAAPHPQYTVWYRFMRFNSDLMRDSSEEQGALGRSCRWHPLLLLEGRNVSPEPFEIHCVKVTVHRPQPASHAMVQVPPPYLPMVGRIQAASLRMARVM
jgi:hypothetical protein